MRKAVLKLFHLLSFFEKFRKSFRLQTIKNNSKILKVFKLLEIVVIGGE